MELATKQWIALRGIFAPASSPCYSSTQLCALTSAAIVFLRGRYGTMDPADVPNALDMHWRSIEQLFINTPV